MKAVTRDLIVLFIIILISIFFDIKVDDFFMNTVYTVLGIMFSIGIGILVTFNLHGIKKRTLIIRVRKSINVSRNLYIYYFSFSTLFFVSEKYIREGSSNLIEIYSGDSFDIVINFSVTACIFLFYSIFYFIYNFLQVQKLNDEIFDNTISE